MIVTSEQLKRYDLITNYRAGSSIEEMEPSDDGEWVLYEQVLTLLDTLSRELERMKAIIVDADDNRIRMTARAEQAESALTAMREERETDKQAFALLAEQAAALLQSNESLTEARDGLQAENERFRNGTLLGKHGREQADRIAALTAAHERLRTEWRARADKGWDQATLSPDEIALLRSCADELDRRQ